MNGWKFTRLCRVHQIEGCGCDDFMMVAEWELRDDADCVLGTVQQFEDDAPYYGNAANGRTGAVSTLEACQKRVIEIIEGQPK